jgi:hypothetical protein
MGTVRILFGAFLTPGSEIRDTDLGSEIRNKHLGSYFRELSNNFWVTSTSSKPSTNPDTNK